MDTFSEFCESREDKTKANMLEFFHKRKKGAAKIASEARSKGGPSMLTAWHFAAKDRPYQEVINAIENNRPRDFFVSKCKSLLAKIRCGTMKQEAFQRLMGELEVYGEAAAQLFN